MTLDQRLCRSLHQVQTNLAKYGDGSASMILNAIELAKQALTEPLRSEVVEELYRECERVSGETANSHDKRLAGYAISRIMSKVMGAGDQNS